MIIPSLLDTDLYKLTMMQAVLHHYPAAEAEFHFVCRNNNIDLSPYAASIHQAIQALCSLHFTNVECDYLLGLGFFKDDFLALLRHFRLNPNYVSVSTEPPFALTIRGPWLHTILFEVPLLAIISEIYQRGEHPQLDLSTGRQRLNDKIHYLRDAAVDDFRFSDFGTRRRLSLAWQHEVVETLQKTLPQQFAGTSNLYLAHQLGLPAIGTMAHEYIQACQALGPRLLYSQRFAFETWAKEYRGDLGIALSDTLSTDAFLHDFDRYFCKLFDGARHDSGDPIVWAKRIIAHYKDMRVDPKRKTLIFRDGLNFDKALALHKQFADTIQLRFGIGTNLSNDRGARPIDIVIKLVKCNGQPVAKISEQPAKSLCEDSSYLAYLKQVFNIH